MKMQKKMKKSNYVVWPAPSSKFRKMARGPKSLATPALTYCNFQILLERLLSNLRTVIIY